MKLEELITHLESIAPLAFQESYDNAGLLVGSPETEIKGVMVSLDATEDIIAEAEQNGCNVVVAHHPIIFKGLKKINGKTYVERAVIAAIKKGVCLYAIHTNLDNVFFRGVNSRICDRLGLINCRILHPKENVFHPAGAAGRPVGSGMIGQLPKPMPPNDFLRFLKQEMAISCIRHTALLDKAVQQVAVCGGAGSFLVSAAIRQHADIFITGDMKYHEFFDADNKLTIADIGHYESEQYTIDLLAEIISEKFSTFAVRRTEVITNPVQYFF